jgi:hypothetical protein
MENRVGGLWGFGGCGGDLKEFTLNLQIIIVG